YDCLERVEGMLGVSVVGSRDGVCVHSCTCYAGGKGIAVNLAKAKAASIRNCDGAGPSALLNAYDAGNTNNPYPGVSVGSCGFMIGSGVIADSRAVGGWWVCFAASGNGSAIIGCSAETLGCAVRVGWGPDPTTGLPAEVASSGSVVHSLQTERCV